MNEPMGYQVIKFILVMLLFSLDVTAQKTQILTVNEPPASYINNKQQPDGYVVDIVKAIQKNIGDESPISFVPEARALNITGSEPNVILFSISRTNSREQRYKWLGKVMTKRWEVFTLANSKLTVNSIAELRLIPTLGVVRGDVREEWLVNQNFNNLNSVTQHTQNIEMLWLGRVDAIVYEKQGLIYQLNQLGLDSTQFKSVYTSMEASVYLVMSNKSSPHLIQIWQDGYQQLYDSGQLERISYLWQTKLLYEFNISSEIVDNTLVF